MTKHYIFIINFLIVVVILTAGCSGLGKIPQGEKLYSGNYVIIDSTNHVDKPTVLKKTVQTFIPVKANTSYLWLRPLLSFHNTLPEPKKKKGLIYFLKYKIAETPVYISQINTHNIEVAVINHLQNIGHFNAEVKVDTVVHPKTGYINIKISPKQVYKIRTIEFPSGNTPIFSQIEKQKSQSIIKGNSNYSLETLELERNRVDAGLKEVGFYYFKSDYLEFLADTTIGNNLMDLKLKLKTNVPVAALTPYRFSNVYVFDDYKFVDYKPDTTQIRDFYYVSKNHQFLPDAILKGVLIKKDSLYSKQNHYGTLRNLMGLGVFKYVNVNFSQVDTVPNALVTNVFLSPVKQKSLSLELNMAIKTTNYAGPGMNVNYKNRNLWGGGELFSTTMSGTVESQFKGDGKGQTSYQTYLESSLSLPRIAAFGGKRLKEGSSIPKTIYSLGGGIYSRVNLYTLNSFNVSLGYNWKPSEGVNHSLKPFDISYTDLAESSEEFEDYLDDNPSVRRSFDEQFIIGGTYNFSKSFNSVSNSKHQFYLDETVDAAGNLISAITTLAQGEYPTHDNQHLIMGLPYSQYFKLRSEFRYHYLFNKRNQIGGRVIAGAGVPYGNSMVMPYVKQFFVGGSNGIRSFIARSIGPGSYLLPDSIDEGYIDQSGDIKLESNIEYRFGIIKALRGALFVDAGNIWLVNDDPQRPGAQFKADSFISEIAVGTGFGLRLDFDIIVVRCDWAFPLRIPSLPLNDRWVIDEVDFIDSQWRRDNLITNISIGYPF